MFAPRDPDLPPRPNYLADAFCVLLWLYRWAAFEGCCRRAYIDGDALWSAHARSLREEWRIRRVLAREIPLPRGYSDPWRDDPEPAADTFDVLAPQSVQDTPLTAKHAFVIWCVGVSALAFAVAF